ncbi:YcxB family protein [Pseudomonas sp. CGJS7]|uniref:YcxB family protein n=1 Tax=Pseudomonas sp. CGJS7 TaxID=3109348 RepID=UPI00300B55CB
MDKFETVTFPSAFSYWDRVRAAMYLMLERKSGYVFVAFWPLLGIGLAAMTVFKTGRFEAWTLFPLLVCLLFVPVMVLLGAATTHYMNKQAREPFTYTFDADGIRAVGVTYEYAHKWPAIFQVKRRSGFLMFFFAPACAHCIPLRTIPDPDLQASLIAMAAANGADTRKA